MVQEGNSGDDMFFISNGMAEILLRACGNAAIHVISDGCYFGEVAVLFGGKRTASIRTLSVSVLCEVRAEDPFRLIFFRDVASPVRVAAAASPRSASHGRSTS